MADILVIKHGALGDVVLATGAMQAIVRHHPDDRMTLLTTAPYAKLLQSTGWFADIIVDDRPSLWTPIRLFGLIRRLAAKRFAVVYDLQTSRRTSLYFSLWPKPKPRWSGIAKGCSDPDLQPERELIHTVPRLKGQLAQMGIVDVPPPRVDFLQGDVTGLAPAGPFALLVPGCAPHRPDKRWPATHYAQLAVYLVACGIRPVLIGTAAEADALKAIKEECPDALDLGGRTSFGQIASLARRAAFAVGNDTGPMHLVAAAPCPVLTLFSGASTPARSAPGWPDEPWLQREPLSALGIDEVLAALPRAVTA
ncbi:MAG TPA: glycosyltransferase family 9 protein [Geminicoccus sp.]|jgi:ADP-heptose:LPS heptosyltransferase|uniref:glycosyltransferase family 9 protein n=1 Tax=Geminicoccus sp. TaxID=2024832 RepID=UPI002E2FB377|nr:glycosyltransferase family 9 protein [Geminicoccus sp.]HEX2527053.1 glycosyltransferase family 9 protein [Geminicoccus sp.]